ncbi:hypothetical protein ACH5RR_018574 [Cinchona calisaya]|uniref:Reverse transcriptase/retrotransposon-derived protein RNase H-like domain-containing protein n=1 Tax=Cinchona calisaya TaxID=153742 RepID=A0ABD2ZQG9_9GENT
MWYVGTNQAFHKLKSIMVHPPMLALPNFNKEFVVETNASGNGIRAVLMQEGRPLSYFNKALGTKHLALSVYEKEMLAMVTAIQKWRPNLLPDTL